MTVRVFRDNDSLSVFFQEGIVGAWPFNCLQAIGNGDDTISIRNVAKEYANGDDFFEIVSVVYSDFVDENGAAYGADEASAVNALNAAFTANGSSSQPPDITSSTSISLTTGETLNYELTANGGVGYEWSGLPAGVTTVEGNIRKLIGGSNLTAGTYNIVATAINYFGTDTETITLTVANPPYNNTKSINFVNQDWLGANADLLSGVLGRNSNGSGSGDAWTISFWYKASSDNQGQTIFYFGDNDTANGGYIEVRQTNVSGQKRLRFRYGSNANHLQFNTPASSISPGTWQHVLVTYDGGTTGANADSASQSAYFSRFKIYIDGSQQTLATSSSNFGYQNGIDADNLRVGRLASGSHMRGANVDELAIWDSDQSGNIASIYNSGSPHDLELLSPSPAHWWRMGDAAMFPVIPDQVGTADFVMYNMTVADIVTDTP